MTEIIALTVFLIALGKKSKAIGNDTPIGRLLSIATGGIVEELVEEGIEGILKLPKLLFESVSGLSDYFRKRKIIGTAVVSIMEAVEAMSDADRRSLRDFLCEAYDESLVGGKCKDFKEAYGKAQKELFKHRNNKKKLIRGFYGVVDRIVDSFTDEMLAGFTYKDELALARAYFGKEDIIAPVALISGIICECTYELKYVSMADEDRDVIKLTQEIVSQNNEKMAEVLMDRLKGYFGLVLSQNSRVKPMRGERISASVRRDPALWIELSCPSCGAVGNLISREGELLTCHLCDKSFTLHDGAGDDVLLALDEMSEAMAKGLSDLKGAAEDVKGELSRLSFDILTSNRSLLETVVFHSDDIEKRSEAILDATGAACESIRAQISEGNRELKEVLSGSAERILQDMERGFKETKDTLAKEADRIVGNMSKTEDRLAKRLDENSEAVKEMSAAISSMQVSAACDEVIKSRGEIRKEESLSTPAPKPKKTRRCSVCDITGGECDEERHKLCGATSDGGNILIAHLSGNNSEHLSLLAEGDTDDKEVVRVELGSVSSDISNESVYTVDFSRRSEKAPVRSAHKKCRAAVLHSDRKIRLSSVFIQRFSGLVGSSCSLIAFSEKITLPRGLKVNGWRLDGGKKALVRS